MKTSVSLSVFPAKKGMPVLFSEATEKNVATIASLGYDGVDLFVDDPHSQASQDALVRLKAHKLGVGVVMPAALAGQGLFLGDKDPAVRQECIDRISDIIVYTAKAGGMVSLGLVRGNQSDDETLEDFYARYTDSCAKLLEIAKPLGVDLLIEPINRYEINTINSVRECLDYIKASGLELYIMADIFHMNIEDVSIGGMLQESFSLIKHVHFLDSNRLAPSMGHLDMAQYYRLLHALGYKGYLCLEALPKPTTEICAQEGAAFFKRMKESLRKSRAS